MSNRDLDAAGIGDPTVRHSYELCRRLNAAYGRTYYLAARLLPPARRPYVHALYGFARYADEIVDDLTVGSPEVRAGALEQWSRRFLHGFADDPILPAVQDTVARWGLPLAHFEAFIASMRMDLTVSAYATYDDLLTYMHGSAAVLGLQMLPVLGHPGVPYDVVAPYARDLGVAFQLTNFIRDVGEDLARGRVYLPEEDLHAHGVTREHLARGVVDGPVRALLAFEVGRARAVFRDARPGIRLLDPASRDCIDTAFRLYAGILDEVERAGYRVLDRRVAVGSWRRAAVAGPRLAHALHVRRQDRRVTGRRR